MVPLRLRRPQVYVGLAALLVIAAISVSYAVSVGDLQSYQYFATFTGEPSQSTENWATPDRPKATGTEADLAVALWRPWYFIVSGVGLAALSGVLLLVFGVYYIKAIDPVSGSVEGLDPMGQIMAVRRG